MRYETYLETPGLFYMIMQRHGFTSCPSHEAHTLMSTPTPPPPQKKKEEKRKKCVTGRVQRFIACLLHGIFDSLFTSLARCFGSLMDSLCDMPKLAECKLRRMFRDLGANVG